MLCTLQGLTEAPIPAPINSSSDFPTEGMKSVYLWFSELEEIFATSGSSEHIRNGQLWSLSQ